MAGISWYGAKVRKRQRRKYLHCRSLRCRLRAVSGSTFTVNMHGIDVYACVFRAPVLVAIALIEYGDMDAISAVTFIREKR